MEKPNYRLESVKASDSLDIAGSLRIGHSKDTLDERTFCFTKDCSCNPQCNCENDDCEQHKKCYSV